MKPEKRFRPIVLHFGKIAISLDVFFYFLRDVRNGMVTLGSISGKRLSKKLRKVSILQQTSSKKTKTHCTRTPSGAQVRSLSLNMTKMELIRRSPAEPEELVAEMMKRNPTNHV